MADTLVVRGAREHNLQNVSIELPRDRLIVFTGLSGSGKSSLAFDTIYAEGQRRYVESLSSLRAAVPRADGQARRRLHRGPVARDLDRPEVRVAQPSVDRRHDHRGLRLPPPALRAHRRAALPERRHPRRAPDAAADRRPGAPAARRHSLPGARAGRAGPQGRVRVAARRPGVPGLRASSHRRRGPRPRRGDRRRRPALRATSSTPSRSSSTGSCGATASSAGSPTRSRPRCGSPRASPRCRSCRRRARSRRGDPHLQPAPRLPEVRHVVRRARAPQLLVQLAVRRVRDVRRARHDVRSRPRARRARTPTSR